MSSGRFFGGLVLGGLLGAVIALLLAPQSGDETRKWLKSEAGEAKDKFGHLSEDMRHHMDDLSHKMEEIRSKATQKAQGVADQFSETVQKVTSTIEQNTRDVLSRVKPAATKPASDGPGPMHLPEDSPN